MLSRGGGAIAFQKVVSKVSDLPSPLDAEQGQRIIVRETEEVYGLNSTTRMWEVIGTLKRVGGKKPEELAAHVDSTGNPHGTSLQDVLDAGTTVTVSQEISITGKGPATQIRLMSGNAALRVGPDAGSKDGVIWLNVGAGQKTILRAVDAKGDDTLVLGTDGIVSAGSATFRGGFKGPAAFEDEIIASEGVQSAEGFDLVLSGDKGVVLKVGGLETALLISDALQLKANLAIKGLSLSGTVQGDLIPEGSYALGAPQARWKSAALGHLDVDGQVVLRVGVNSTKAPLQVTGAVPGDGVILTAGGELGLGTDSPDARLDVRGDILVDSGLRLTKTSIKSDEWAATFGAELTIVHKDVVLLRGQPDGTTVLGSTKVQGDLVVAGKLALGGISGLHGQEIAFAGKSASYKADLHEFHGPMIVNAANSKRPLQVPGLAVEDGNLLGEGDIKGWNSAHLVSRLVVGTTVVMDGAIAAPDGLTIQGPLLTADALQLRKGLIKSNVVRLEGHGGSAEFNMSGPNCGLSFEGKHWVLEGVDHLEAVKVKASSLDVSGPSNLCDGAARLTKEGLALTGQLSVGGLAFKKIVEEVELDGLGAQTKFELPAGVRIEAVLVRLKTDVTGARFLRVGDAGDPDRFASPSTDLKAGALIRGLNHWGTGRAVQKVAGPVFVIADAVASGALVITIHYVDPAAL